MRSAFFALTVVGLACSIAACGGGSSSQSGQPASTAPAAQPAAAVVTDKNAYPVFVNPDEGADPSVPADKGGKGFTGEGWERFGPVLQAEQHQ